MLPPSASAGAADPSLSHVVGVLAPGWRLPFGHAHSEQQEVYVLVNGSARIKIEDEIVEMTPWTAIRVAATATHSLEGGPEGAELIAIGAPDPGHNDAEPLTGSSSRFGEQRSRVARDPLAPMM